MKVSELIAILNNFPGEMQVQVLEKLRSNGFGNLVNIVGLHEVYDQDTNIPNLVIETDYVHGVNK